MSSMWQQDISTCVFFFV